MSLRIKSLSFGPHNGGPRPINKYSVYYPVVIFAFLIISSAALKSNAGLPGNDSVFGDLSEPVYITYIEKFSPAYLSVAALCGALIFLSWPRLSGSAPQAAKVFIAMTGYAFMLNFLRYSITGSSAYISFLPTFFLLTIQLLIYVTLSSVISRFGVFKVMDDVCLGFAWFSVVFIAINMSIYLLGEGYVSSGNRFFGSTHHPNFLGIITACCNVFVFRFVVRAQLTWRLLGIGVILCGLYIMYLTGSRTSIGAFVVGFAAYIWFVDRRPVMRILFSGIVIVMLMAVAVVFLGETYGYSGLSESPLSRDGNVLENTRAEVIQMFLVAISDSPIFGVGSAVEATSSSYLRGWASDGILYFIAQIWLVFDVVYRLSKLAVESEPATTMLSISVVLFIGALFEGYLLDNFSVPILLVAIITNFAFRFDRSRNRKPFDKDYLDEPLARLPRHRNLP